MSDPKRQLRIAWLPNHTTLREFEVPLLRALGYEVYTNKSLPRRNRDISGSCDLSDDAYLTMPPDAIAALNRHNFFEDRMTPDIAAILNEHFETVIALPYGRMLTDIPLQFKGRVLFRAFGGNANYNYTRVIREFGGAALLDHLMSIGPRFWLAAGYDSIPPAEEPFLRERSVVLPLGLPDRIFARSGNWVGDDRRLLFVCPRIAADAGMGEVYKTFKAMFDDLPHCIGGPQPVPLAIADSAVTGSLAEEQYRELFKRCRVMFYHSREPRHVHYHPIEAVIHGMPLIFMRGGVVDGLAGDGQPGACNTMEEARVKVQRVLDGDKAMIAAIKERQGTIADKFTWEYNLKEWKRVFQGQVMQTDVSQSSSAMTTPTTCRIEITDKDNVRDNRVAWLINHTTLRGFEVPLIRSLGKEVYTSKLLASDVVSGSASTDYSDDRHSTLSAEALRCLNEHNFYTQRFSKEVSRTLNRHFGTVICAAYPIMVEELVEHYRGRILLRAFGRETPYNYTQLLRAAGGEPLLQRIAAIRERFWLAPSYDSIAPFEEDLLRERSVMLPLGLPDDVMRHRGTWTGTDERILFICPRIASLPLYFGRFYREFKEHFGDMPHLVGGDQPDKVDVDDPAIAGRVSDEVYSRWFRECRVMFYHSREPRHVHYHPLEAVAYGMPLIYMRGGLIDAFGGEGQPGACDSYAQARDKIRRIMNGDTDFLVDVRQRQGRILETFGRDYCRGVWQRDFVQGVLETKVDVEEEERTVSNVISDKLASLPDLHAGKRVAWLFEGNDHEKADIETLRQLGYSVNVLGCDSSNVDAHKSVEHGLSQEVGDDLSAVDWNLATVPAATIEQLNRHFSMVFVAAFRASTPHLLRGFAGKIVWRVHGRAYPWNYTKILSDYGGNAGLDWLERHGNRLWLAASHETILESEEPLVRQRSIVLPAAISASVWERENTWTGNDEHILVTCDPKHRTWEAMRQALDGLAIEPCTEADHALSSINNCRALFHPSCEPRQLVSWIYEAMAVGTPLIFLRGGLLERLFPPDHPGACSSYAEARAILNRLVHGDPALIRSILEGQSKIIQPMHHSHVQEAWRKGLLRIENDAVSDNDSVTIDVRERVDPMRDKRVVWLPQYTHVRDAEIALLRSFGLEVYTPKILPRECDMCGVSIDYAHDAHLTLPAEAVRDLNMHSFSDHGLSRRIAEILNRHFGTVISTTFGSVVRELPYLYEGRLLFRAFGREHPSTYAQLFADYGGQALLRRIGETQNRFWLAASHDAIAEAEDPWLRARTVVLPAGLPGTLWSEAESWRGKQPRILIMCPRIRTQPSMGRLYEDVRREFEGLPYLIGGGQPQALDDSHVSNFVPEAEKREWFRDFKAMFVGTREPRQVLFDIWEALAIGMPVVFLSGGLLERLIGPRHAGACATFSEARKILQRLLAGDSRLEESIRHGQRKVLDILRPAKLKDVWRDRFVRGVLQQNGSETHKRQPGGEIVVPAMAGSESSHE